MKFSYTRFQAMKFREEAAEGGEQGGGAEGAAAEGGDDTSLLTGGEEEGATGEEGSDEGDDSSSEDDEAGKEGSNDVPETYADFTLPEGMEVDVLALDNATPIFKELGLTQDQAQQLVSFYAEQVQAGSQQQIDDFNQLMTDWKTQSKNDSEFGGEKFGENLKIAQSAISKYGTPGLKQLLEDHGVGNHPEMIRFMVKVGNTLKEDVPGEEGGATTPEQDRVTQMYGDQSK